MKDTWNFLLQKRPEVRIFSATFSFAVSFKKKEKKCEKPLALVGKLYVIVNPLSAKFIIECV